METQVMGMLTAEFMVSEANGYRSRAQGVVAAGTDTTLEPGTILGQLTSNGNYVRWNPGASNGSQTVAGILYASATDTVEAAVVVRDAEVVAAHLTYNDGASAGNITAANTGLAALGIIVREG